MTERYESKRGVNYDKLPPDLRGSFYRYIEHRVPTGGFLEAVLSNDLADSFGRADQINRQRLFEIVRWLYNEAPALCWGSREKVKAWLQAVD